MKILKYVKIFSHDRKYFTLVDDIHLESNEGIGDNQEWRLGERREDVRKLGE
ncbi:MAG: hypothetical protein WC865_08005 [Bacteroidales bacterium]